MKDWIMIILGIVLLISISILGLPFAMIDGGISYLKEIWVRMAKEFMEEFKKGC